MFEHMFMKYALILSRLFLWPAYWLSGFFPRDHRIIVFGSQGGGRFGDNPKYLYLYVNEYAKDKFRPIWITKKKSVAVELRTAGFEVYYLLSFQGIFFVLRSGVWVFDHRTDDVTFWLSKGATKINLWHGLPMFKKFGWDDYKDKWLFASGIKLIIYRAITPWHFEQPDLCLSPSSMVSRHHKSAMNIDDGAIIVNNYPRTAIFSENFYGFEIGCESGFLRELSTEKNENKKRLILYMPTFRDRSDESFFELVDLANLNSFMGRHNALFIVKAHPYSSLQAKIDCSSYDNIRFINPKSDVYPFLALADILITDYSSVYMDYLLLDRPIIFFCYDLEEYLSINREMYYEYGDVTSGPKVRDYAGLMASLEELLQNNDAYKEQRRVMVQQFYASMEVGGCESLLRQIEVKLK